MKLLSSLLTLLYIPGLVAGQAELSYTYTYGTTPVADNNGFFDDPYYNILNSPDPADSMLKTNCIRLGNDPYDYEPVLNLGGIYSISKIEVTYLNRLQWSMSGPSSMEFQGNLGGNAQTWTYSATKNDGFVINTGGTYVAEIQTPNWENVQYIKLAKVTPTSTKHNFAVIGRIKVYGVSAGVSGDPHFKTWAGESYDFHGVCDLVLLSNPMFMNKLGMDIHIRTEKTFSFSFVKSAAIRIGDDTLEVQGGTQNQYWINGNKGEDDSKSSMTLSSTISGYPIQFNQLTEKAREFVVDLGIDGGKIIIKTWNAFVSVHIEGATNKGFGSSLGLMGAFRSGKKMARDNETSINDNNLFGQEWQVLPSEPKLFHDIQGPQAPEECEIPSTSKLRRRLAAAPITLEDAQIACSRVSDEDHDICVFDVMATNDASTAGAY